MKDLVEKYLKQKEYHDKAWSKASFWEEKYNRTLNEIRETLIEEELFDHGNIIDVGNGMVIKVNSSISNYGPPVVIQEKKLLKK